MARPPLVKNRYYGGGPHQGTQATAPNPGLSALLAGLKNVGTTIASILPTAQPIAPTPSLVTQEAGYLGKPVVTTGRQRATSSSQSSTVPSYVPPAYVPWVQRAAQRTGLPASVVAAQINKESSFDPRATSPTKAKGLAQFEPGTWKTYGKGNPSNAYKPAYALDAYSNYMSTLLKQYHGNVRDALAAYYAGPGNVQGGYGYADSILSASGTPAATTTTGGTPSTQTGTAGYGGTRPGGNPVPASGQGSGQGVQQLFESYEAELTLPRVAPSDVGISGPLGPFQWWLSSYTNKWNESN